MTSPTTSENRLRTLLSRLRSLHLLRIPPDCELTRSQIGMLAGGAWQSMVAYLPANLGQSIGLIILEIPKTSGGKRDARGRLLSKHIPPSRKEMSKAQFRRLVKQGLIGVTKEGKVKN